MESVEQSAYAVDNLANWLTEPSADINPFCGEASSVIDAALNRLLHQSGRGARHVVFLLGLRERDTRNTNLTKLLRQLATDVPERLRELGAALKGEEISAERAPDGSNATMFLDQLNLTLARAHRTTHRYSDRRFSKYIADFESFQRLPRLTRKEIDKDISSIISDSLVADFYTATSATTTGRSLLVPHNHAELKSLADFSPATLRRANDERKTLEAQSSFGMTLRLMPSGRLIGGAPGSADSMLATYDTNAIKENVWDTWDYIIGQVFSEFPAAAGPRKIETIHATPAFGIILLTKYMVQRGLSPADSRVRTILITGSWVGPHTRRWIEETWQARLFTTYSCAELTGAAVECPLQPGRYHFSSNIFAEVLDTRGKHVSESETGTIHLTGLFPFQQCATFLRYNVGDWGRWRGFGKCKCGLVGPNLEMLGRSRDVLTFKGRRSAMHQIAPVPIRNALDRFSFVPRIPRPQHRIRIEPAKIPVLVVDLECYALGDRAWQRRAVDDITAAILEEDLQINRLVDDGEIELRVVLHFRSAITQLTSVI